MKIWEKHCYNDSSVIYIASSKSCEPKRFVRRWNRVGKIFKNNSEIMGFVNGVDKNVAKYWYLNKKKWWFPFASVVDVVILGTWVL